MNSSFRNPLLASLLVGLCLGAPLAKANLLPITGGISFDAVATTNTGNLGSATALTSITSALVAPGTQTGDYSIVPDFYNPVAFTPFSFSAAGVTPLWTFTLGGVTYSFDATSIAVTTQTSLQLDLSGSGTAYITGFAPTDGDWTIDLTHTGHGSTFSFGSSAAATPDQGTTALLIVLGLAGVVVALLSRRASAAKA